MKKLTCLLLTLLLLVPCFAALAEAAEEPATEIYAEPILFRGIPWGSTWEEAQTYLPEGIEYYETERNDLSTVNGYLSVKDHKTLYGGEYLGKDYYTSKNKMNGMKVAGYELESMYLYFAGMSDDSGYLVTDETHSALLYTSYTFNVNNTDAVYEDLLGKLTSLYGNARMTGEDGRFNLWYGADGTMVSLCQYYGYIYICYGFSGADALIEQAHQVLMNKEVLDAGNSTDGL